MRIPLVLLLLVSAAACGGGPAAESSEELLVWVDNTRTPAAKQYAGAEKG
ncbi:hypothetical protein [Nonomuraea sp. NPDC049480]